MSPPQPAVAAGVSENHRYPDQSPSESADEEDSTSSEEEEGNEGETGSSVSERSWHEPMAPTTVVKIAREKVTHSFRSSFAAVPAQPTWPVELTIVPRSKRDVTMQLCQQVLMLHEQNSQQVPRSCVFVACRALGMNDGDCGAVLFGIDEYISVDFFYNLIDREAQRMVTQRVNHAFRHRDRFSCGELQRSQVLSLLCSLGMCSTHLPEIGLTVTLKQEASDCGMSTSAVVTQVVPQSDPPQRTEVVVQTNPKAFQMFVDNARGEVTCNGVPVCSRVLNADSLAEVVQAMQLCVFVMSLVDAHEVDDNERTIEYEPLIEAVLTSKPPEAIGNVALDELPRSKSLARENILALMGPTKNVADAMRTDHVAPFLHRSSDRRAFMIPQALQTKKPAAAPPENVVLCNIVPREVYLQQDTPRDATRYLTITLVTTKNVIMPSVRVYAKPFKVGEDTRVWNFAKKTVRNNVLLAGDKTDILYIEVCMDTKDGGSVCAGFATHPLGGLQSGAMGVKSGTFFRPAIASTDDRTAGEETSSCFCFSSTPSTRIVVDAKHLSWQDDGDTVQRQSRIVILERHAKITRTIRDFLSRIAQASSPSRALRWQYSQAIFSINEKNRFAMDQLSEMWNAFERTLSKEQRADLTAMDLRFADFVSRTLATINVLDELQNDDWGERLREAVLGGKQIPAVTRSEIPPVCI